MIIYSAVVCDEEAIPPFRVDSAVGTIDFLDRKEEDPERWNVFQKRLTYTCPVGFIIDRPDGDYSEQPDPIPEEQYSFEVSFLATKAQLNTCTCPVSVCPSVSNLNFSLL